MTGTSTTLRRLCVAGVAAGTMAAGAPLLLATPAFAQTAPGSAGTVTITPAAGTGASNTCQIFTLDVADLAGNPPSATTTVNVVLTDPNASATSTATPFVATTASFCTVTNGVVAPTTGNNITGAGQTTNQTQQQFLVAPGQRQTTFGVFDREAETVGVLAFIDTNTPATNQPNALDAGEPNARATATFTSGGATRNAANDAVRVITAVGSATPTAAGGVQNIQVRLTNAAGDPVANAVPSIRTNTGGANSAGTVNNPGTVGTDSGSCTVSRNDGTSVCSVLVPNAGTDSFTIFVNQTTGTTAGPDAGEPVLVVTRTTAAAPNINVSQARNIDLTPEGPTTTVGGTDRVFTATVVDAAGRPVRNVLVFFNIQGAGAGTLTSFGGFTDVLGQVSTTLQSAVGQAGQTVVVATIASDQSTETGTQGTQCSAAAGAGGIPATSTSTAGNCSDFEATNFSGTTPTPGPIVTPGVPATGTAPITLTVAKDTIVPTEQGLITVRATPNSVVELSAYSRPSTTYRVVRTISIGADGTAEVRILPGTNTRLFASYANDAVTTTDSPSVVQNVATALSLSVVRNGTRNYTFQGRVLPRRAGQLITLYRVSGGREIITAQVVTDSTGTWRINRRFTGSGTFGFVARTGQNLTNVAGVSNGGVPRATAIF